MSLEREEKIMSDNAIEKLEAMRDRLRAQLDGVNMCISLMQQGEEMVQEVTLMQNRLPFVGKTTSPKSDTNGHGNLYMIPRAQLVEIMRGAVEAHDGHLTARDALTLFARHCKDKTISNMQDMGMIMNEAKVSKSKNWQNAVANFYTAANRPGSPVKKIGPGTFKLIS
jgi:hypothetical protein